jgi:N-acetylglucosamine kinase-like BadF-type ATPase
VTYFLGIDGGGNQTTCVVGNETEVLGWGAGGASNVIRVGEKQAKESLRAAVRQACAVAGVEPGQIRGTCIGVAGADRPEQAAVVKRLLAEAVAGEIKVAGDMVIGLRAAFADGPGVLVIAGTGSQAFGRNKAGGTARAGGWGFAISDEGSGHWIGRMAVGAALRAYDRQEPTQLLNGILSAWKLESVDALIPAANASPGADFSSLLPAVLAAADAGDRLARSVLTQAGEELSTLAEIVVGRLFAETPTVPVAMVGGVFRHSELVRQVFYNNLRSEYPNIALNPTVIDPVRGALELARGLG